MPISQIHVRKMATEHAGWLKFMEQRLDNVENDTFIEKSSPGLEFFIRRALCFLLRRKAPFFEKK